MKTPSPSGRSLLLRLVLVLLVAEAALLAAFAFRRPVPAGTGWSEVGSSDPRVAGVFAVLERNGLSPALDSLVRQAAGDSAVLRGGHQLAHALGRRAQAVSSGDASVIGQCRSDFGSGCYHGVVEAFLNARGGVDMAELERMCASAGGPERPGPVYECMHGLGHGVLGVVRLDYARALHYCDALSRPRFITSCQEGVFMEAIDAAVAGPESGGAHSHGAAGHAGHAEHTGQDRSAAARLAIDPRNPYSPCARFADAYAESCWIFQGFLILRGTGFDAAMAFHACDAAPDGRAPRCYESVGHQLTGLLQRDDGWILQQCAKGRPALAARCAAGATLALDAMDWSGARSARLCAAAPSEWKETCYTSAAASLASYATPNDLARFCEGAESVYAQACRGAVTAASRM